MQKFLQNFLNVGTVSFGFVSFLDSNCKILVGDKYTVCTEHSRTKATETTKKFHNIDAMNFLADFSAQQFFVIGNFTHFLIFVSIFVHVVI